MRIQSKLKSRAATKSRRIKRAAKRASPLQKGAVWSNTSIECEWDDHFGPRFQTIGTRIATPGSLIN